MNSPSTCKSMSGQYKNKLSGVDTPTLYVLKVLHYVDIYNCILKFSKYMFYMYMFSRVSGRFKTSFQLNASMPWNSSMYGEQNVDHLSHRRKTTHRDAINSITRSA